MKIESIFLHEIEIPFKNALETKQTYQEKAHNVITEISWNNGIKGYGESAPKSYLTRESVDSVVETIKNLKPIFENREILNLESLKGLVGQAFSRSRGAGAGKSNAALCGLDLALIDSYGRNNKIPAHEFLGGNGKGRGPFEYTMGVPIARKDFLVKILEFLKNFQLRNFKIKLGKSQEEDLERVRVCREYLGKEIEIRVDVNGGWDEKSFLFMADRLQKYDVRYIEDPLPVEKVRELKWMKREVEQGIIIDDFSSTMENAEIIVGEGLCDAANIKISKCGGLLNSLELYRFYRKSEVKVGLGCQLGETAILEGAGRAFAVITGDLLFLEGSVSDYYLKENIASGFTVGKDCLGYPVEREGLGFEMDKEKLKEYTVRTEEV